jgi:hypothetical protein
MCLIFFDAGWQKVSDHNSVSALPQKSIREAWRLPDPKSEIVDSEIKMGLTGLELVTLRLSSACSNQLSYTPAAAE